MDRDARADQLAANARDGDLRAFEDLCRLLRDDVWRYCMALLGDREQAFDATQETFLRLVKAIRGYRGDGPVRVYVLVIARRAVAALIAANQRRRRLQHIEEQQRERASAAEVGTIEVAQIIDELPEDQKQAFVLTQVVGMTYDEAAAAADVAIGTIRSRVSRARTRLAEAIDDAERS